jgi:hypothetical protein
VCIVGVPGDKLPLVPSLLASGSVDNETAAAGKRPATTRAPQVCSICCHSRFEGTYKDMHSTGAKTSPGFCTVPIESRVPVGDREKKSHKKKNKEK